MDVSILGKKILFICPKFFDYHSSIIETLTTLGADVYFFDERPSNSTFSKMFLRINKNLIKKKIDDYYFDMLEKIDNNKFDYVLIFKAEAIPKKILYQLKSKYVNTPFVLYLWDSIENNKNVQEKLTLFDKVYSFDENDCEKFDLKFRPLFFSDEYNSDIIEHKYILTFIGTLHSDRYNILNDILKSTDCKYNNFIFMYLPSPILYVAKKLLTKEFHNAKIKEFNFKPLTLKKTSNIIETSKIIIDIQHPKQTGLTMRTIETLGANKKLITCNKSITEYDFYNSRNILVIDRENPQIPSDFLEEDYVRIDPNIKKKYDIRYFLLEILMKN